jgi:hypothetical protein
VTRLLLASLSLVLWAAAASAQTTITFDPLDESIVIFGYTEGGIVFGDNGIYADRGFGASITPDFGGIPSNGTAFISSCGTCVPSLQAADGGLFDLLSVDLGEFQFFGFGPSPTLVFVSGVKEDGSTVRLEITTDGIVGFESFALGTEFTDLVSAEIATFSPYLAIGIDDIGVRAGLDKPALTVSPASGIYTTQQAFDLALIVVGVGASAGEVQSATLDGTDFSAELDACAIEGNLDSGAGTTLRCSIELAEGLHTFEATFELPDGSTTSDTATWEVLASTEP